MAYEFYGGKDKDGKSVWTNDFQKIKPLIEWDNNMGCVTATYNPVLKKYIMCVTDGGDRVRPMWFTDADHGGGLAGQRNPQARGTSGGGVPDFAAGNDPPGIARECDQG